MKITLPNGTVLEIDDTPSRVKQVDVKRGLEAPAQADDVVGERTFSGDPVATEKRVDKTTEAPTAKEKPVAGLPEAAAKPAPQRKEEPTDTTGYSSNMGGVPDISDPNKGKPGYFQYVAPKEEGR